MDAGASDLGSGHLNDDFKIKGAAHLQDGQSRQAAETETCTICLQPVLERAVAVPCNHLTFDFLCLVSWLQERPACPLCNAVVARVEYDWRSPTNFKTYVVPGSCHERPLDSHGRRQQRTHQRWAPAFDTPPVDHEHPSLAFRRTVYQDRLYSMHVGTNSRSGYRNFAASEFLHSTRLQQRAKTFLRRELQVFRFLDGVPAARGGDRQYLVEYIIAVLKSNDVRGADGHAVDLVAEFLGRQNAQLLLHELHSWLRSPFASLAEWDQHVQYQGHSIDTKS